MSPLAIGLFFVLEIFLSISLSHKSFIVQPAALITTAPIRNMIISFIQFINFISVRANTHQPGNKSNQNPTGRSNLPNLTHFTNFLGKMFHQPFSMISELLNFGVFINNGISL